MTDELMCNRTGCSRRLRRDNRKGVCSYNCESPDAPSANRAVGVKPRSDDDVVVKPKSTEGLREKFETVATALGFDPDTLLDEARQGWLVAAGERLREANEEE